MVELLAFTMTLLAILGTAGAVYFARSTPLQHDQGVIFSLVRRPRAHADRSRRVGRKKVAQPTAGTAHAQTMQYDATCAV